MKISSTAIAVLIFSNALAMSAFDDLKECEIDLHVLSLLKLEASGVKVS